MSSINSEYKNRTDLADQYRALQEKKEQIREENERELDVIKNSYNSQKADLEDRFEQSIQSERMAHYDHLRNLKNQMSREARDLEAKGKENIRNKESTYTREQSHLEIEGKTKLDEAKKKYAAMEQYEYERARAAEDQIKHDHRRNADLILKENDKRLKEMVDQKEDFLHQQKITHSAALNQIQDHYHGARTELNEQYHQDIRSQAHNFAQDLNARKLATASVVEAYEAKAQDPFYRIQQFDAEITDMGNAYALRVKIPEYERAQFRVQVAGQNLQLVGNRTTDQSAEIAPGNTVATRTHQSISERVALEFPVDARGVTWVANGDWVEYNIPKLGPGYASNEALKAREIAIADAEIGRELSFVESLPKPKLGKGDKGTSTLG